MSCGTTHTRRQAKAKSRVQFHARHVLVRQPVRRKTKNARRIVHHTKRNSGNRRPVARVFKKHRSKLSQRDHNIASAHAKALARARAKAHAHAVAKNRAHMRALARARARAKASAHARATAKRTAAAHRRLCHKHKRKAISVPHARNSVGGKALRASRGSKGLRALRELAAQQARIASYGP